ncbi:MAG: MFS transporter [Legionella sp.]|nr:MFS transporter [Legionella sp.]
MKSTGTQLDNPIFSANELDETKSLVPFFILWVGQFLSTIGNGISIFVMGIYVYQVTGSAIYYSLLLLVSFMPSIILKPLGGALADRNDRRVLMLFGDVGSFACMLFIIAMLTDKSLSLWPIYIGIGCSSICNAIHNPAFKASVTDLVDRDFYAKASGLMQLVESSKLILSPIIAGILMGFMEVRSILVIDLASFLLAAFSLIWVKCKVTAHCALQENSLRDDLFAGFRFVYLNKGILYLLGMTALITFFIGFLQALWGPMVLSFASAKQYGISLTIATCGMLVSSMFIGLVSRFDKKTMILSVGFFLAGICFACMGISVKLSVITSFAFMFFLTLPFINTSLDVLIRNNVDNEMQGRVWSIVSLISQSGLLVALGVAGFLADKLFNPLLTAEGVLAHSVGLLIGTGSNRGIGLLFILSGLAISLAGLVLGRLKVVRELEHPV